VTTRGNCGAFVFWDDEDRLFFVQLLRRVVRRYGWRVHAYCLMGTHYHLVVETLQPLLSAGMQRVNGRHAEEFNRKYRRTGHLFGDRFGARVVEDEEYLAEVCRYVINNPVRAGLCATPADWPWSACRYGLDV